MTKKSRRRVSVYEERYTLEAPAREFYKHNKTKGLSEAAQKQYTVSVDVEISDQFFGWICGFGKKAKIVAPKRVVEQFAEYIDKIKDMYIKD